MSGSFSRLFDHDREMRTKTYYHYDATTDKVTFETKMDVEGLIEVNKARYNQFDERSRWGEKLSAGVVASIPMHVYFDLKRKGIADDEAALAKWCDDPANSGWRTRPGRLSKGLRRR
jgi:hypothetical protein